MNTTNHLLIGKILYDYFERSLNIRLNESRFLWGNIAPDYDLSLLRAVHTRENYWETAAETLRQLSHRGKGVPQPSTRRLNVRLGIVCHFLADFFCYAHTPNFHGGLAKHIAHERRLELYCRRHYRALQRADFPRLPLQSGTAEQAMKRIERLNDDFQSKPHSFESEILGALAACSLAGQAALYTLENRTCEPFALYGMDELWEVSNRI